MPGRRSGPQPALRGINLNLPSLSRYELSTINSGHLYLHSVLHYEVFKIYSGNFYLQFIMPFLVYIMNYGSVCNKVWIIVSSFFIAVPHYEVFTWNSGNLYINFLLLDGVYSYTTNCENLHLSFCIALSGAYNKFWKIVSWF